MPPPPRTRGEVAFSTAFNCGAKPNESICLADPFPAERTVVLLKKNNSGICTARTKNKFNYEGLNRSVEVTRLSISSGCSGPFSVAIVGVEPSSVRLNMEKPSGLVLSKKLKQARELLDARQRSFVPEANIYRLSEASPKIIGSESAVLFAYTIKTDVTKGPNVLFLGDSAFVSEGWCTSGHTLFHVQNRLYLGYVMTGCGGGEYVALIYDLSSGKPKEIYANAKFST